MKTLDLHGQTVEQAEKVFDGLLNEARIKNRLIEVLFITGVGKLHARLQELAKTHDLHFYVPMNNQGCLVIEFE